MNIRHRACAQACKGVLVMLREVTSSFNVLVIFFDFGAFGGSRIPPLGMPRALNLSQNHCFFLRFGRVLASRRVPPFSWRLRSTKNQYFLIPEHQKSIFSVPRSPKINIYCPRTTEIQYFWSLDHQKSIFTIPGASKINIFCLQATKKHYLVSPDHQKSIVSVPGQQSIDFCFMFMLTSRQMPQARWRVRSFAALWIIHVL